MERVRPYLQGALGFLVLAGLFYGGQWVLARYAEFSIMKAVTLAVVCKDFPADAAKIGVACQAPAPPAGNASPPAPTP